MTEPATQGDKQRWADTVSGYGSFVVEQHDHHWCVFDVRKRYFSLTPVECFMSRTAALLAAESMFRAEQPPAESR